MDIDDYVWSLGLLRLSGAQGQCLLVDGELLDGVFSALNSFVVDGTDWIMGELRI